MMGVLAWLATIWTIAVKELKTFFVGAIGYVVIGAWLLFAGIMFVLIINSQMPVADMDPIFRNCILFMVMFVPLLTMRLLAGERPDEQGSGTIELLLTSPITEWQLVLGKYLATLLFLLIIIATSLIYVLAFALLGDLDDGKTIGGYIGFILFGGYILALGLLFSSLTSNQIVAAVTTIVVALFLWLIYYLPETSSVGQFLRWFSFMGHIEDSWGGVINLADVIWHASAIFLLLFATKQIIASNRWR